MPILCISKKLECPDDPEVNCCAKFHNARTIIASHFGKLVKSRITMHWI